MTTSTPPTNWAQPPPNRIKQDLIALLVLWNAGTAFWLVFGIERAQSSRKTCQAINALTDLGTPCDSGHFTLTALVIGLWIGGSLLLLVAIVMQQDPSATEAS
ncbi:MAG TPA: hypothetical protein VGL48_07775 [Acidimicrobiales bacterium]|jgi:hypothetical protein